MFECVHIRIKHSCLIHFVEDGVGAFTFLLVTSWTLGVAHAIIRALRIYLGSVHLDPDVNSNHPRVESGAGVQVAQESKEETRTQVQIAQEERRT